TIYAFGAILPDFGRLVPWEDLRDDALNTLAPNAWYPLGSLGFEADNDGNVTKVEYCGPAWAKGIREGDMIDLSSLKTERRAVNQFGFVAIGRPHTIHINARFLRPQESVHDVTTKPCLSLPDVNVKALGKPVQDSNVVIGWVLPERDVELTPNPEHMSW